MRTLPVGSCGRAVIIDEIGEDGAINPDPDEGAPRFAKPHIVKVGVKSFAGLPLRGRGRLLGVVYLHSLHTGTFHGQLSLLVTFANQVAGSVKQQVVLIAFLLTGCYSARCERPSGTFTREVQGRCALRSYRGMNNSSAIQGLL